MEAAISNQLLKLKELVKQVPNTGHMVDYDVKEGSSLGIGLFKNEQIAVQQNELKEGTIFPAHAHDGIEVIIVYEGEVTFHYKDEAITLKVGDVLRIPAMEEHFVTVKKDSKMIGITIPPDRGYPNGE
jgi:quercetin dioxygenase-like cupin family protein